MPGDVQDGIQAQQVDQARYGPSGMARAPVKASSIRAIDRPSCSWARQISAMPDVRMRLTTNLGTSAQVIGCLRIAWAKVTASRDRVGGALLAFDDLDQGHDRRGIEVVEADHEPGRPVAPASSLIESEDVFEARIAWPGVQASSSAKTASFELEPLGNRLDHEVDVARSSA